MTDDEKRALRNVLGTFVTGVTVVTTVDGEGRRHGVTANSFSSVSLDPPLVLWSQALAARSHPAFKDAEYFAVNILSEDQVGVSDRFARSGADKFEGADTTAGLGGAPILADCAAVLECRKVAMYPGGDHAVFLGRVERHVRSGRQPLAYGGGGYMQVYGHDLGPAAIPFRGADGLRRIRRAIARLPELSREIGHTLSLAAWGNRGPTVLSWAAPADPVSANLRAGLVLDILATAAGRAFSAFLPPEATTAELERALVAPPAGTGDRREALLEDLGEIRRRGLARAFVPDASSIHGVDVVAFSAPVYDSTGAMVLALTATARAGEVDAGWHAPMARAVLRAARSLSTQPPPGVVAAAARADGRDEGRRGSAA